MTGAAMASLLEGDGVAVRACTDGDVPFLYQLASDHPERWLRLCGDGLPNPHLFAEGLWDGVLFIGVPEVAGLALGVVCVYQPSFLHGTAWLEVVGEREGSIGRSLSAAAEVVVAHAFRRWPLRKLYVQHGSFEGPPLQSFPGYEVEQEARLPEALFHDRLRWDLVVNAVWPVEAQR